MKRGPRRVPCSSAGPSAHVVDRVPGAQHGPAAHRAAIEVQAERPLHHQVGAVQAGAARRGRGTGWTAWRSAAAASARPGAAAPPSAGTAATRTSAAAAAGQLEAGISHGRSCSEQPGGAEFRRVGQATDRPQAHGPVSTVPRARPSASRTMESGTPNPLRLGEPRGGGEDRGDHAPLAVHHRAARVARADQSAQRGDAPPAPARGRRRPG